ncbi:hypothetical protein DFR70_109303 [Nocardia tenerifensis]|uniref:Uncharacterized protein n=1 Tax=Nocardia tenerifensis TaxID=228006 RepID=A0A318JVW8_9NOCA|nr:hypothetical protein DFR70_109303 [Nocardia tenerifensis]
MRRKYFRQRVAAALIDVQAVTLCARRRVRIALVDGDFDPRTAQSLGET